MTKRGLAGALTLFVVGCEAVPTGTPGVEDSRPPNVEEARPTDLGCDDLIVIEAVDTAEGVARERAWLLETFPGAEVINETQSDCDGTPVDRVVFIQDGVERTVMFDTSSFYGRVDGDDLDDLLDG